MTQFIWAAQYELLIVPRATLSMSGIWRQYLCLYVFSCRFSYWKKIHNLHLVYLGVGFKRLPVMLERSFSFVKYFTYYWLLNEPIWFITRYSNCLIVSVFLVVCDGGHGLGIRGDPRLQEWIVPCSKCPLSSASPGRRCSSRVPVPRPLLTHQTYQAAVSLCAGRGWPSFQGAWN